MQDVRYAIRGLRSSPGFAAVAILSLALGIGANTAIFSLIDSVILKTLPVSHPEQLLQVTPGERPVFHQPDLGAASRSPGRVFRDIRLRRSNALTSRPEGRRAMRRGTMHRVSFLTRLDCAP